MDERQTLWRALKQLRAVVSDLEAVLDASAPPAFTERLIGSRDLFKLVDFTRATLRARIKEGTFPAPVFVPGASAKSKRRWRWSEVDAYVKGTWRARTPTQG